MVAAVHAGAYLVRMPSRWPAIVRATSRAAAMACMLGMVVDEVDAQLRIETQAGGARVSQPDFPAVMAATLQSAAAYGHGWLTLDGTTLITIPTEHRARIHGSASAAARTDETRRIGGELRAMGSVYNDAVFPAARAGALSVNGIARGRRALAWVGGSHGLLDDQVNTFPLTTVELGAAHWWPAVHLGASATFHATQGEPRTELSSGSTEAVTLRDPVSYTDVVIAPRIALRAIDVDLRGGVRLVHQTIAFEPRRHAAFGSIDVAWWGTPRIALVAALGRDLSDLRRGIPAARYVTLGIRARVHGTPRSLPGRSPVDVAVAGVGPDVLFENGGTGGTTLRVLTGVAARQVEVAATFTQWEPISLTPAGAGAWVLAVQLPSGPHRLVVRVDGGAWTPPANLPTLDDDDLGARVGVVTIP